jgi:hypothetical protein
MDCPFGFSAAVRFDHGYTGLLPVRVQYNKFFAEVVHLLIKFFNFLTVVYADAPGRVLHTEHIGYVVCTIFLECRESEPTPLFYFSLYADPPQSVLASSLQSVRFTAPLCVHALLVRCVRWMFGWCVRMLYSLAIFYIAKSLLVIVVSYFAISLRYTITLHHYTTLLHYIPTLLQYLPYIAH